jgi:excisionase family DNA binding protein
MPPRIVTAGELAKCLNVTYDTVLGWARRDEIPSIRTSRGRRLFVLDAVLTRLREKSPRKRADEPESEPEMTTTGA